MFVNSGAATVQHPKKEMELLRRWVREGLLYQVPAANECGRTFVSTVDEILCVQGMSTVFRGILMTEDELSFFRHTECTQYPALQREYHRAYNVMKTMDGLRRVLGLPVDPVDWTLSLGNGVQCEQANAKLSVVTEAGRG